jgi:hypothetical protein
VAGDGQEQQRRGGRTQGDQGPILKMKVVLVLYTDPFLNSLISV